MNRVAQRWFERYHALARAADDLAWQWEYQRRKATRWQALAVARREQVRALRVEVRRLWHEARALEWERDMLRLQLDAAVPLTASVSGFPPCPVCGCWGGAIAGDVLTCARCARRWRVAFVYQEVAADAP